ncbi:tRNA (N6-isopentenyl adenosine(37)-C2)-methylthiotransferase MiaB [Acidiferrobacter sp.]|uniref:tRNA (N6-isopentenyl adenosine(37)-C2)-methylthiotransferase MiaB n=1 Tax=Acidiferrobacter sp. TaxID=1872107 RepID=UPI0026091669|nr:tRNA (N6-isopentenyl adenosine(37)-C2)-methylthiotransferase MiaB [Acidiferrobacter sp.]
MAGTVYIKTYGCQMNEYDSARLADLLHETHGLVRVDDPARADVLLVNSCSVREKAEEKLFSDLGRLHEWKAARPGAVIGVGGCVASQEGEDIRRRAPYVDFVFGPQTVHRVPALLADARAKNPRVDIAFVEMEKFDNLPEPRADGPRAFVSIMEGCSKYCSFCVVPYTRGQEFSRPFDDVLAEVAMLAEQGVREVTLLGQNVNAYRGRRSDGGSADLATLIGYVAHIEGIGRIRFTTSHPLDFTDSLLDAFAAEDRLVAHLHLPVQSGSDRILARMKRGYTVAEYRDKVERLRYVRPGISLSTDIIVGFPGETDEDFAATMALIEEMRFDLSYSFAYSPRPGTPAAMLVDDVPAAVKAERLARVLSRNLEHAADISRGMIGGVERILIDRRAPRGRGDLSGRTENNRVVNFPGGEEDLVGRFATVEILEVRPNSLRGRLVGVETRIPSAIVKQREAAIP